ncbi:MAG: RNA polymerase sigma factor [Bdellovibrionales bacterium]|nr:RNA polymerase sigma factor [Bdellovibrionales bacterium]
MKRDWESIVTEYYDPLYRYCYQYHGNRADAEDATQQTFLKAYQSLDSLQQDSSLKAWLYSIARNVCIDRSRRWKRFLQLLPSVQEDPLVEPKLTTLSRGLLELIQALPTKQREVFILRHWHDFSTDEVASLLSISNGTVKTHLKRAVDTLRKELESRGEFSSQTSTDKDLKPSFLSGEHTP